MTKVIRKKNIGIIAGLSLLNIVLFSLYFMGSGIQKDQVEISESVMNLQEENPLYVVKINLDPEFEDNQEGNLEFLSTEQLLEIKNLRGVLSMEFLNYLQYSATVFLGDDDFVDMISVSTPDFLYLSTEQITLTTGRTFTEDEMETFDQDSIPVMIPQSMADEFELEIGSNLSIKNDGFGNDYNLTVIGTFEAQGNLWDEDSGLAVSTSLIIPNTFIDHAIITPLEIIYEDLNLLDEIEHSQSLGATFILNDSINLEEFISEASRILGPAHIVEITPLME